MLKKINLNNSTLIFAGILFILVGISFGFLEYFDQKKDKVFLAMNLKLYENEKPEIINDDNNKTPEGNIDIPEEPKDPVDDPIENPDNRYNFIGIIEIPKISVKRGFLDINSPYNSVDYNITVINSSKMPDYENGNLILAAHSGICNICYFNDLYKLSLGDSAYIYYNNIKYIYNIVNIYEVEKTGVVKIERDYKKNTLTLITCTRNTNNKQTVYILELVSKENY